jgi:hypothetical protein
MTSNCDQFIGKLCRYKTKPNDFLFMLLGQNPVTSKRYGLPCYYTILNCGRLLEDAAYNAEELEEVK